MRLATEHWLEGGSVSAMGWSERVRRDEVQAFESRARAEGLVGYRVFDRHDDGAGGALIGEPGASPAPTDSRDVFAVRLIEPVLANASALGVNSMSVPAARAANTAGVGEADCPDRRGGHVHAPPDTC